MGGWSGPTLLLPRPIHPFTLSPFHPESDSYILFPLYSLYITAFTLRFPSLFSSQLLYTFLSNHPSSSSLSPIQFNPIQSNPSQIINSLSIFLFHLLFLLFTTATHSQFIYSQPFLSSPSSSFTAILILYSLVRYYSFSLLCILYSVLFYYDPCFCEVGFVIIHGTSNNRPILFFSYNVYDFLDDFSWSVVMNFS